MVEIWIVWWISSEGDSPEITVFTDQSRAQECWTEHVSATYECDIDEYHIYPEKPIDYSDCSNAMLKMWMEGVLTDGEYNKIMDKLNRAHNDRRV